MLVTDSGIVSDFKDLQSLKASASMLVTDSEILMDSKLPFSS